MGRVYHATREHLNAGGTLQTLPNGVKGDIGLICVLNALERLGFQNVAVNPSVGENYDVHAFKNGVEVQIEVKNHAKFTMSTYWVNTHVYDRFPPQAPSRKTLRVLVTSTFDPQDPTTARKLLHKRSIKLVKIGRHMLRPSDALKASSMVVEPRLKRLINRVNP